MINEEMRSKFIRAIQEKRILRIEFFALDSAAIKSRSVIPLDISPSRRPNLKDDGDRLHTFNKDSNHIMSLTLAQVTAVELTDESFTPADVVKWDSVAYPFVIERNW